MSRAGVRARSRCRTISDKCRKTVRTSRALADATEPAHHGAPVPLRRGSRRCAAVRGGASRRSTSKGLCSRRPTGGGSLWAAPRTPWWRTSTVAQLALRAMHGPHLEDTWGRLRRPTSTPLRCTRGRTDTVDMDAKALTGCRPLPVVGGRTVPSVSREARSNLMQSSNVANESPRFTAEIGCIRREA